MTKNPWQRERGSFVFARSHVEEPHRDRLRHGVLVVANGALFDVFCSLARLNAVDAAACMLVA
jgi:hypothetical protein